MDLPQLLDNLCTLMDAIIPYVHSCEEALGHWQSQDGLDAASSVYLWSLSSVLWIGDGCCAPALVVEAWWALWTCTPWEVPPSNLFTSYFTISLFYTHLWAVPLIFWELTVGCPHPLLIPPFHLSSPLSLFPLFFSHPSALLSLAFKGQSPALLAPTLPVRLAQ